METDGRIKIIVCITTLKSETGKELPGFSFSNTHNTSHGYSASRDRKSREADERWGPHSRRPSQNPECRESARQENGATSGDPPPHPPLTHHGGASRRRRGPAPRPGAVARAANVLPRRPPHPRRGRRPRPRCPQEPSQGRPLQGDPRRALREGSGAGQPGHGGGGDGDRGGVQARDPRYGGRQDRLAPARHRVRRQPPHGRLSVPPLPLACDGGVRLFLIPFWMMNN